MLNFILFVRNAEEWYDLLLDPAIVIVQTHMQGTLIVSIAMNHSLLFFTEDDHPRRAVVLTVLFISGD